MLARLISLSLRHRLLVVLASAALVIAGVIAFRRLPIDAFPDTTPVQVQINTAAPALSPLEIERQITAPVEQALAGLPKLAEVRSLTRFGLSQVTVIFEDGTDVWLARQVVGEQLQRAELPPGVRPALGPVATGLGEVFHYLVTGDRSLAELRTIQDWVIRPQLRAVRGVAEINAWGGDERQIQVIVDPLDLHARGLSLPALAEAIERNNRNVGGGPLDQAGESSLVQGVGLVTRLEDIEAIPVATHEGVPVRVRDVAQVVEGREIRRASVTADGAGEAVLGLGFMMMGESTDEVTRRLARRLDEVQGALPEGVRAAPVYDRTTLVDHVLRTVRNNLLEGALLVVAVLFAFLGNLRAGLIVAAAIPLSLLFAFDLMLRAGVAGTLMSLGAIDFGLIVDSSVIMVENSARRLAEDRTGRPAREIVEEAALEVRRPTLFGELIIMIVYLPILALEGVEGKLFRPMALTVIFALLGSMILSVTLMPALASLLLRRPAAAAPRESRLERLLLRGYRPILRAALRRRRAVLAGAALALAGAALVATRLGAEFVPELGEGSIVINTVRLSGVSLDESTRYGTQIERALRARFPDEIERIWTRTGTPEVATDPMGVEVSDVFVTLTPASRWRRARTQEELTRAMQQEIEALPGMRAAFTQPIEMRVNEMSAGIRSDLGVKLFGDDLDTLKAGAREIEAALRRIPGAADVTVEQVTGQPVLQVEVDRAAIARHGVAARDVLAVVEALGGIQVGELQEGERRFPIAVRLHDRYRRDPESLGRALVTAPGGDPIPLARLAKIEPREGPAVIQREWGKRRIVVQANVRGRDVGGFVEEAMAAMDKIALPEGYYLRYGGQYEHLARARERLALVVPASLLLILGLLYVTYGRLVDALRVFTGVPFAAIGGVVALWIRDIPFSVSAAVGFIALSGVSVLGDMVLVSTIRRLLEGGATIAEAIEQAAERRLRPVLMTALVAGVGFLPMAFSTGVGAEVQRPLATVVIGGVISSTLLTLLVLPVLYAVVAPRRA